MQQRRQRHGNCVRGGELESYIRMIRDTYVVKLLSMVIIIKFKVMVTFGVERNMGSQGAHRDSKILITFCFLR